jgi:hypothetical protein
VHSILQPDIRADILAIIKTATTINTAHINSTKTRTALIQLTVEQYALPHRGYVTLTVFNTLGQKVAELVKSEIEAGNHEVQFSSRSHPVSISQTPSG